MVEATKHVVSAEAIKPEPVLQARKLCKTYQMGEITVTSVTPCTFYVLDRKDVEELMEQQPSIRIALQRADQRRRGEQAEAEAETKTEKQTGIK